MSSFFQLERLQVIIPIEEWFYPVFRATCQLCLISVLAIQARFNSNHAKVLVEGPVISSENGQNRPILWSFYWPFPIYFSILRRHHILLEAAMSQYEINSTTTGHLVTSLIWPLQFGVVLWNLGSCHHVDTAQTVCVSNKLSQSIEVHCGLIDLIYGRMARTAGSYHCLHTARQLHNATILKFYIFYSSVTKFCQVCFSASIISLE